jgi:hypothetical protein
VRQAVLEISRKLKGAAMITNRIEVDLSPDLVARIVRNSVDASGNLRGDTGVSMSPSNTLPR